MKTSKKWIMHFRENALQERVDWNLNPAISESEITSILHSLQAWQLGETSDGAHLIHAATIYAHNIHDLDYIDAVKLFIKEEQKHGNNLGKYLDSIQKPRIKKDWGDTLFRKIRYFNTNMEIWTVAVITVESAAQVFYQCLKNATDCTLLKQICTDILIDEAYHIDFQTERMAIIFDTKSFISRCISRLVYPIFFFATSFVVWFAHKKLFRAGGTTFEKYMDKMKYKYFKTLHRVAFHKNGIHVLSPQISY
jgi:hypothetical protein